MLSTRSVLIALCLMSFFRCRSPRIGTATQLQHQISGLRKLASTLHCALPRLLGLMLNGPRLKLTQHCAGAVTDLSIHFRLFCYLLDVSVYLLLSVEH